MIEFGLTLPWQASHFDTISINDCGGLVRFTKRICSAALVVFVSLTAVPVAAQDASPGGACAGADVKSFDPVLYSSTGHLLVCNNGFWTSIIGHNAGGDALFGKAVSYTSDISPASIGANQNNYAPAGHASATVMRLAASAPYSITGLQGGSDGRIVTLMNIGSNAITLTNEDAASTAANRFLFGSNVALAAGQNFTLIYDSTSQRWRSVGALPGAGSSSAIDDLSDAITHYGNKGMYLGQNAGLAAPSAAGFGGNTALGVNALRTLSNTSAIGNAVIGSDAAYFLSSDSYNNTLIGVAAAYNMTQGYHNVAVGQSAGHEGMGFGSIAIGSSALNKYLEAWNTTRQNIAIGMLTMNIVTSGARNTVIGTQAVGGWGKGAQEGAFDDNTLIGHEVGTNMNGSGSTVQQNTIIGSRSGTLLTTGNSNILIGYDTEPRFASSSSELNIGSVLYGASMYTANGLIGINDSTPSVALDVNGAVAFSNDISPASIGASQNNYAPTGHATAAVMRLTASGAFNITGLAGGVDGRIVTLMNIGSSTITLTNEDAASTAANRFALGASLAIAASKSVVLIYDSTSSRWREFSSAGSGGGGSGPWVAGGGNDIYYNSGTPSVGIGNTDPAYTLDVSGNIHFSSGSAILERGLNIYKSWASDDATVSHDIAVGTYSAHAGMSPGMRGTWNSVVLVGPGAGANLTTGGQHVFIGAHAGEGVTGNHRNTFIGHNAGAGGNAFDSVAIGSSAGSSAEFSNGTVAVGHAAGMDAYGSLQVMLGYLAGEDSDGDSNALVGAAAGRYNDGWLNVAVGHESLLGVSGVTDAHNNVAIGAETARVITSGDRNVLVGYRAGNVITTGSDNIVIGYDLDPPAATSSSRMNIGGVIFGSAMYTANGLIGINNSSPNAALDVNGTVALSNDISPASIGASQNNYAPAGHDTASVMRLTASGAFNITGLAGGVDGRMLTIFNIGASTITLTNQDGASTAANRFAIGSNIAIATDQAAILIYDSTSARWRAMAR